MIVYCGYIGGDANDGGGDIAVDEAGNAYITGTTGSSEATFPVSGGPDLILNGGDYDVFVAKVNAAGTSLAYCGYIGGDSNDYGSGIAVDGVGNAYVTGHTYSTEATFPVSGGPDLTHNGLGDAFVAKVNTAGTGLAYCGYIGGANHDVGLGITVDRMGNAYIAGGTESTEATFPISDGPDLTYNGDWDAFVTKVNAAGTGLAYCGYIGGDDWDRGWDITVAGAGNAYLTGPTESSEATFPVSGGPDLTFNGGDGDAYVAKVKATGTSLAYCGYIGGDDWDEGDGIVIDAAANAYVTGGTYSAEATFPVSGGPDLAHNGEYDAFVAKVAVELLQIYLPVVLRDR